MIDFRNAIFSRVVSALEGQYFGIDVTDGYISAPAVFPHVSVSQVGSNTLTRTITDDCGENHAEVVYQMDIYTNQRTGRKENAWAIAGTVDDVMIPLGFRRISMVPTANVNDATIYRITARYAAVISKNGTIYRR